MANANDFNDEDGSPKGAGKDGTPKGAGKDGTPKGAGKDGTPKGAGKGLGALPSDPRQVAVDVFQQVSQLGGFLVVAVVAPLPFGGSATSGGAGPRDFALSALRSRAAGLERERVEAEHQAILEKAALFERAESQLRSLVASRYGRTAGPPAARTRKRKR